MKRHDLAKREWLTRDLFEGDRLDQAVNPFLARVQARVAELQAEARKDASDVPELLKKLAEEQEGVRNIVAYIAKTGAEADPDLRDDLATRRTRIRGIEERLTRVKGTGPVIEFTLEEVKRILSAKLNEFREVLTSCAESGRQILQKHIRKITLTPGLMDGKRVYHVVVEFEWKGEGNSGVLLTATPDASMQQYGFSTITVTGLALDTSRVRRKPMPLKQTAENGGAAAP
jgi:hypothetical protein